VSLWRSGVAWLLALFYFSYFALVGVYVVFLPKMLTLAGYTPSQVGMIFAAAPLMRFALPFLFRKFGGVDRRTYLGALLAVFSSAILFFPALGHFGALFLANLLYGAAMGVILPYVDTIALQTIEKVRYGRVRLWGSIGFMAISLWLGRVLETPKQSLAYLVVLALATLLSGWFLVRYDRPDAPNRSGTKEEDSLSLSRYWAFWISAFLLQVSFGGFYNFFTIYETAHGISLETVSWLWSFGVLCEIAMLYWQGPLLRHNLQLLIEISVATTALRWAILWLLPDSLVAAFAAQSLHALNFALYYTAAIAYVYTLYRQKKLAQQFFLGITFGLGGAVGALLAGAVYDRRPEDLFLVEALVALASWGMMRLHRRRKERHGS
jgi:PPP family 3-phenylpropionic acid transporter